MKTDNKITIELPDTPVVDLPISKSIGNRLLCIGSAATDGVPESLFKAQVASHCDDLRYMTTAILLAKAQKVFKSHIIAGSHIEDDSRIMAETFPPVEIGESASAMRFLTALLASSPNADVTLKLSGRLSERPLSHLADAICRLGGEAPQLNGNLLRIKGRTMAGGHVEIPGNISSQYASALMMAAPNFTHGLQLTLTPPVVSTPYIEMTAALMRRCGAQVEINADCTQINVAPSPYSSFCPDALERDWSAAAFMYEYVALTGLSVKLPGLTAHSLQGDSRAALYFAHLGVTTRFTPEGAELDYDPTLVTDSAQFDMTDVPDMVPALAVSLALKRIPATLSGVATLRLKECDRLEALRLTLQSLDFEVTTTHDTLKIEPPRNVPTKILSSVPPLNAISYPRSAVTLVHGATDHRIVMAFLIPTAFGYPIEIPDRDPCLKSWMRFPFIHLSLTNHFLYHYLAKVYGPKYLTIINS